MQNYKKGFTLIELLIVIAIIGVVAAVIMASIGSGNVKARVAAAHKTLKTVQSAALMCLGGEGLNLVQPTANNTGGNLQLCPGSSSTSSSRYAKLPVGWVYSASGFTFNVSNVTFVLRATGDGKTIECTEKGCKTL